MIYKNIEIHNAAEIIDLGDGITWTRFPHEVCNAFECPKAQRAYSNTTGVELRFVIKGDEARIKMSSLDLPESGVTCTFHVYYGSIQGGWADDTVHRIITAEPKEFIFRKPENIEKLKCVSKDFQYDMDPAVVRVIFDRGHIKIGDIVGDIEPPKAEQLPEMTMLNYGSSITHGSNSIDMSHAWTSIVSHNLNVDCRNLGMAGSCWIEPKVIDYIASEGVKGKWDFATMELGINVLDWEEGKIRERVTYAIQTVASLNPDKPIIVISPFYSSNDYDNKPEAAKWRSLISEIVSKLNFKNVYYKSGLDFIDNMSFISADEVHPNIYGVQQIADKMTEFIKMKIR